MSLGFAYACFEWFYWPWPPHLKLVRCGEINLGKDEWTCLAADSGGRGFLGVVVGALPSIFEGVFFELILATQLRPSILFI